MIDYRYFGIHFKEGKEKFLHKQEKYLKVTRKKKMPKKNKKIKPNFKI